MSENVQTHNTLAFLDDQTEEIDRRITRLNSALSRCEQCAEQEGLRTALRDAEDERAILQDLRETQQRDHHLSLDAVILEKINRARDDITRLARYWHRGRATPDGYWQAELRRTFLGDLLRRYHAWYEGRPYYPQVASRPPEMSGTSQKQAPVSSGYAHPWLIGPAHDVEVEPRRILSGQALEHLHQAILDALAEKQVPEDHLDVIVEANGQVIATGYVHTDLQREDALDAILDTPGVREALTDIKVVPRDSCPICTGRPELSGNGRATTPPPV